MRGKTVVWKETGEVFESLRAVAERFDVSYNMLHRDMTRAKGIFGIRPGVTLEWESYTPERGEEFRPIPGFEGRYSISNLKNVRTESGNKLLKPTKPSKGGAAVVVLYSDSIPCSFTVRRLFKMAWPELCDPTDALTYNGAENFKNVSKPIRCITDGKTHPSYIECCKFYHFDYQTFRKAVKAAEGTQFRFRDKEFDLTV